MTTNFALKLLLIISIVLQSFTAVSATVEFHQLSEDHVHISHDIKYESSASIDNEREHDLGDCHEFGHCSGNHTSWILVRASFQNLSLDNSHIHDNFTFQPTRISNILYRPPKA